MRDRCIRSIEKAEELLKRVRALNLSEKEKSIVEKAEQYINDARYFLSRGDFFSSFGASDYAYGLLEALLFLKSL